MSDATGKSTKTASVQVAPGLSRVLREAADTLTAIPFPSRCPVCGGSRDRTSAFACPACTVDMPQVRKAICPGCRLFRAFDTSPCPSCQNSPIPAAILVVSLLDIAWRDTIHALKYGGDRSLAKPLGTLLAKAIPADVSFDSVVPIPTELSKQRERGYGHAELLAKQIAGDHRLAVRGDALVRTRRVKDQTRLRGSARFDNLNGAFRANASLTFDKKRILLVDDVMTTGATIGEAARALTAAGARQVLAIVLCLNLGIVSDGRY